MPFLSPRLSPLCLTNQLLVCRPSPATLLCVTDFRTQLCGHSFVHCLGTAERVRLAGSRQLVWDTVERWTVAFWQANSYTFLLSSIASDSTVCSILILPFVLSGVFVIHHIYVHGTAHREDESDTFVPTTPLPEGRARTVGAGRSRDHRQTIQVLSVVS